MLLYHNKALLRVILQYTGTVIYRPESMLGGLICAGLAALNQALVDADSKWAPKVPHHYGILSLSGAVAFAVVFRTNLGWTRYWEAVTNLHMMYSKWTDAYSQVLAFCQVTIEEADAEGQREKAARVRGRLELIEQDFHLMSALSVDRLAFGDSNTMETRYKLCGGWRNWNEQITHRHDLRRMGDACVPLPRLLDPHEESSSETLRSVNKGSHGDLPRTAISANQVLVQDMRDGRLEYVVKRKPATDEHELLQGSLDRVNVVMYWIVYSLARIAKDVSIPPPIQSRIYQELSNGMLGFTQALKISDVPFPFPYAQLLTLLLGVFSIMTPIYVVNFTDSKILGPILAFLIFVGIWGINEVAKELENPFGTDSNDISLPDFHARFIDGLQEINRAHVVRSPLARKLGPAPKAHFGLDGLKLPEDAERQDTGVGLLSLSASSGEDGPPEECVDADSAEEEAARELAPTGGAFSEVFDLRLAVISSRMEQHLARIASEIEAFTHMAADPARRPTTQGKSDRRRPPIGEDDAGETIDLQCCGPDTERNAVPETIDLGRAPSPPTMNARDERSQGHDSRSGQGFPPSDMYL